MLQVQTEKRHQDKLSESGKYKTVTFLLKDTRREEKLVRGTCPISVAGH